MTNAHIFLNSQINPNADQIEDLILPDENSEQSEDQCSEEEIASTLKVLKFYAKRVETQISQLQESIKEKKVRIIPLKQLFDFALT